jgi:broad specificity phosphatase PhoE
MKGLGLARFPQLQEDYFRHYQRIVYFAQNSSPELRQKAEAIADYLKLPLEIRETGYGLLEERLVELMAKEPPARTLPNTKDKVAAQSDALNANRQAEPSTSPRVHWHERKQPPSSRRRERKFKRRK